MKMHRAEKTAGVSVVSAGRAAITAVLAVGLCGCVGVVPVAQTDVGSDMPERTSPIVVGQSTRPDVHALLGKPWLASEYWRFDAFRIVGRDVGVLVAVMPLPVPAVDKATAVVLVSYGSDGIVNGREFAIANDASVLGPRSDTTAELDVGEVRLTAGEAGQDFVSVSAARRDEFLGRQAGTDQCRLLVGCEDYWCGLRVGLDGHEPVDMPYRESTYHYGLLLLEMAPGEHQLSIRSAGMSHGFDAKSDFSCARGEQINANVQLEYDRISWPRSHSKATIALTRDMPPAFRDRRLLIWGQGRWLVAAEPGP
jgi:hypothetical protein